MGTRDPFTVTFDREMDDALQRDQLDVADSQGRFQAGQGTTSVEGRVWSWRPKDRWRAGDYQLVVGGNLEDVSGNRVGEALDHEAGAPDHPSATVAVPFTVGRPMDLAPRSVRREAMNENH
jgi:hypothetical protein